MLDENVLLIALQSRDIKAFKTLISYFSEDLTKYCIAKLRNFERGKLLVDDLLSKWLKEGFEDATSPLFKWMLVQVDVEIYRVQTAVN
jgi:hypothetical protein